jgi:sulfate transport system permease protein
MSTTIALHAGNRERYDDGDHREPAWVKVVLIGIALAFFAIFLLLPLIAVFAEGLRKGWEAYLAALIEPRCLGRDQADPDRRRHRRAAQPRLRRRGGVVIAKFEFPRQARADHADRPAVLGVAGDPAWSTCSCSAPRAGSAPGWPSTTSGIIFAVPGIVLATSSSLFPFVARELIPLMEAQGQRRGGGRGGARRVRLAGVLARHAAQRRWGLLYGVILCNARAMGEFGAVSVVSGHIRGLTNTMPLHVEILYNEYNYVAAFAVASLLALLALVTLALKTASSNAQTRRAPAGNHRRLPTRE